MKRVFIYTRVSTTQQLDGGGLPRQLEICQSFVDAKEWSVARIFTEAESGSVETMDRPQLREAISLCTPSTGVSAIVVERADRIARDLIVSELFFRECKAAGVEVYSADTGEELVNADADPTRILIRQILGALAQWEKTQIARKLLAGRKRMKEKTGFPCGGKPVFGRTPEQAPVVAAILFYHRSGISAEQIARKFNYGTQPVFRSFRKIKRWWANGTIRHLINTWNHRAEFATVADPVKSFNLNDIP